MILVLRRSMILSCCLYETLVSGARDCWFIGICELFHVMKDLFAMLWKCWKKTKFVIVRIVWIMLCSFCGRVVIINHFLWWNLYWFYYELSLQPIDIDHKALGFSTSRLGQSFKPVLFTTIFRSKRNASNGDRSQTNSKTVTIAKQKTPKSGQRPSSQFRISELKLSTFPTTTYSISNAHGNT